MSLADLGDKLVAATQNPLFQFGIGMLGTPAQRNGRPSWAQVLGNGGLNVERQQYMQQMQQQQAQQLQAQQAQQAAMQRYISALPQDQQALAAADPAGYIAARAKATPASTRPFLVGGKLVSPTGQVIYGAPAAPAPVKYSAMSEDLNGIPTYLGNDGRIYQPRNGSMAPIQGTQGGAQGVPAGLPAETQAYVPGVMGRLAGAQATNPDGTASQALINAVMQQESGGNPNAVSSAGAVGPMQLMPATAASVGVQNIRDPQQNIAGGTAYLNQLLAKYHGNVQQALAAYNAGPTRVDQALQGTGWAKPGKGDNAVEAGMPGDPSLSGSAYIASLPDNIRGSATLIAEGKAPWPTGYVLKTAYGQQLVAAATKINPAVDATSYGARAAVQKSAAAGPIGTSNNAFNTALQHASALIDANQRMGISNLPFVGDISASLESVARNPAYKAYVAGQTPFATEMARAYKGGAPAEGEIDKYFKALDPSQGQRAVATTLQTYTKFLYAKALSNARQYQNGMRDAGIPNAPLPPETAAAVHNAYTVAVKAGVPQDELDSEGDLPDVNAVAGAPAARQSTGGPAVGAVEGGYRFKGGDPSQQSNWVKVQ